MMDYTITDLKNYLKQCELPDSVQRDILSWVENYLISYITITPSTLMDYNPFYSEREAQYLLEGYKQYSRKEVTRYTDSLIEKILDYSRQEYRCPAKKMIRLVRDILIEKFGNEFYGYLFSIIELEQVIICVEQRSKNFVQELYEYTHYNDITKIDPYLFTVVNQFIDSYFKTPLNILIYTEDRNVEITPEFELSFNNYVKERYKLNSTEIMQLWSDYVFSKN